MNILLVLLLLSAAPSDSSFVDERDGHRYRTMRVGELEWMRENLAWAAGESWCYGDDPRNCEIYGRLYRYDVAQHVCPSGWRLPTDEEWMALESWAGLPEDQLRRERARGTETGARLRIGGDTGFDLVPAGYREDDGSGFSCGGKCTAVWSGSELADGRVWHRDVRVESERRHIWRSPVEKEYALSVRCVR